MSNSFLPLCQNTVVKCIVPPPQGLSPEQAPGGYHCPAEETSAVGRECPALFPRVPLPSDHALQIPSSLCVCLQQLQFGEMCPDFSQQTGEGAYLMGSNWVSWIALLQASFRRSC